MARSVFGNFRMKHNIQSRRKKERPKFIQTHSSKNPTVKFDVPVAEHPAPVVMYKMRKAGILEGFSKDIDTSNKWEFSVICSDAEMAQFKSKYGQNFTFQFRHVPEQFSRTLAKIGHAYAIAHLGLDNFNYLAPNFILGKEKNLSYLVGGDFDIPPIVPDAGHILQLAMIGNESKAFIVVEVRLFASCPTPQYHVVVAEIEGITNIKSTLVKLQQIK